MWCFVDKVDAINYYADEEARLRDQVDQERATALKNLSVLHSSH